MLGIGEFLNPKTKQMSTYTIIKLTRISCTDPDDEIDMVYAERNVLHEEATTVEAETITVDRFRQRFCNNNTAEKSQNFTENANNDQQPKYKAPPPPPRQRRTSSSSTIIKVSPV